MNLWGLYIHTPVWIPAPSRREWRLTALLCVWLLTEAAICRHWVQGLPGAHCQLHPQQGLLPGLTKPRNASPGYESFTPTRPKAQAWSCSQNSLVLDRRLSSLLEEKKGAGYCWMRVLTLKAESKNNPRYGACWSGSWRAFFVPSAVNAIVLKLQAGGSGG